MSRKLVHCNFHKFNLIHTDYRIRLQFKISNIFLQLPVKFRKENRQTWKSINESKKKIVNSNKLWTLNNLTLLALVTKLSHLIYSVSTILKSVWRNNNLNFGSRQGNEMYAFDVHAQSSLIQLLLAFSNIPYRRSAYCIEDEGLN